MNEPIILRTVPRFFATIMYICCHEGADKSKTPKKIIICLSFMPYLLSFSAFLFKKKSTSGTTKVEYPAKVTASSVLANRNVNVPKNSLLTKSSVTFSNKLERTQKSKINSFFTVNSKCQSDSVIPACRNPPAVSGNNGAITQTKTDNHSINATNAPSFDPSQFPLDDWDDFDDFETPVKTKNDSFSSGKVTKPSSPDEEFPEFTGKQSSDTSHVTPELIIEDDQPCMEIKEPEHIVSNNSTVSPGPGILQETVQFEVEDSPVRGTRRRPFEHKSVLSDSEDDTNTVVEKIETKSGK